MRIAFDAKRITHNATGLGNYSRFVVNGLSRYFPENDYLLFSPSQGHNHLRQQIESSPSVHYHLPEMFHHRKLRSFWRSYWVSKTLQERGIDLFHGLSNELPLNIRSSKVPSIVTIHDLIFLRYPEFYKPIDRAIYKYKFKKACTDATHVVAVSESTKRDIISFFGIDERKISVVYQGCNPVFGIPASEESRMRVIQKYALDEPFILYVGSIESRKNLLVAVKAMKRLQSGIRLVAIGRETAYTKSVRTYIHANGLSNKVSILNNVPFEDLPIFYQMAKVVVYPSLFEGFGIPLLEALSARVPVIGATGSCLEEAGGPGSLYFNPSNADQLSSYITQILNDSELAGRMVSDGLVHLQKFQPETLSSQMMSLYREICRT